MPRIDESSGEGGREIIRKSDSLSGESSQSVRSVLDTSFFFTDLTLEGEISTTPSVCEELKDLRSRSRLDQLLAVNLRIESPSDESLTTVIAASKRSGDYPFISETDRDIIALSYDLGATLFTDDFAVQNISLSLGIKVHPIRQRRARRITWKHRCQGCGRYSSEPGECLICGSEIRRCRG